MFLSGEPGAGKTRLAKVLSTAAEEAGVRVVWARPQQYSEALPYLCFLQIAGQLGEARQDGSTSLLRETRDDWASLSADTRSMRSQYVLRLARSILDHAKSGPLMLVVDDLQWADVASLLLLSTLTDLPGKGFTLVCLSRTDTTGREDAKGLIRSIEARCHRFELGGLAAGEVHELAADIMGPGRLSESESQILHKWTSGNPLFVRTLLKHLDTTGLLSAHGMQEALKRSETPRVVSDAVDATVRDLGSEVRRMLSAGAVLGDEFDCDVLAAVLSDSEDAIAGRMRAACDLGVTTSDGSLRSERMRFVHPLFRQRLYELLPLSERRALHSRVIEIAEEGALLLTDAELATHHVRSARPGVNQEAASRCRTAAIHAEKFLAYESAGRFWEMALDCVPLSDVRTRAELLKRQGWALWAANSWKRSEDAWGEAIVLYENVGESVEVAELALAIGDMMRWRQDVEGSEKWTKRALLDLPEDSLGRARALAILGSIQSQNGPAAVGLDTLQEAVRATEAAGGSDPRIDFWLSYGLRRAGEPTLAKKIAERGLTAAESTDDAHGTVILAGTLARLELADLNPKEAGAYLSRMDARASQADTASILVVLQTRAYHLGYSGEWERVSKLCESTKARLRLAGSYQLASVDVLWAEAQFALGNWQEAAHAITEALPALEEMAHVGRVHIARILAASGEAEQASDDVRNYLDAAATPDLVRSGAAVLADAAAAIDDPDLWNPAYELVIRDTAEMSFVYSPISLGRVKGRLATRLRRWDDAMEHFESAIDHLSAGEAIWELQRTCQDFAVMRRARGRRGDAVKADALEARAKLLAEERRIPLAIGGQPFSVASSGNLFGLSSRELEVLQLVSTGLRNREIAERLQISPHTVERHLENVYSKMNVGGRTEAVMRAADAGLLIG